MDDIEIAKFARVQLEPIVGHYGVSLYTMAQIEEAG